MAYKDRLAVAPDVVRELQKLKRQWKLQSHNKVLRRLLGLSKDGAK